MEWLGSDLNVGLIGTTPRTRVLDNTSDVCRSESERASFCVRLLILALLAIVTA